MFVYSSSQCRAQRERERSDEETGSFEMRRSFRLLVGFDTLSNCVANTKTVRGEKDFDM
jgi:hypothetical protein